MARTWTTSCSRWPLLFHLAEVRSMRSYSGNNCAPRPAQRDRFYIRRNSGQLLLVSAIWEWHLATNHRQRRQALPSKVWALRNFSLELRPGVLGLLGPNGAGKTTLMNIIATITRATEGTVTWNGADLKRQPDAVRAVLGYLPQDFGVYPNLNAV